MTCECDFSPKTVMYELTGEQEAGNPQPPPQPPVPDLAAVSKEARSTAAKTKGKCHTSKSIGSPQPQSQAGHAAMDSKPGSHSGHSRATAASQPAARAPARSESSLRRQPAVSSGVILNKKFRDSTVRAKLNMRELNELEERQKDLRAKKHKELRTRFGGKSAEHDPAQIKPKKLDEHRAYAGPADLPIIDARSKRLQVDPAADALLVPIHGAVVPFHLSTIKNMSRSTLDRFQLLRVNFFTPGQGKTIEDFPVSTPSRVFVKELTFRSEQRENLDAVVRAFKDAHKRFKQREIENDIATQKAGTPETQSVALQTTRQFHCLRDLNLKPAVSSNSRRPVGTLEAHLNGFRFVVKGSTEKIDILYSQVRHAIFQPCEGLSLVVLLHLHLHEPIAAGKRKTQDLQFFTEVGVQTEDLSQRKSASTFDPDEILEEQNQRQMKERLNACFQSFCKKVEESHKLTFDIPYKDTAFTGVVHKSSIELSFCKHSLVGLQEWPPVCIDLSEVDIVVFERAVVNLREFDMVLVKKNYDEMPVRITTIPKNNLDSFKRWFGQLNMIWYVCSMNMQWAAVMKEVTSNLPDFLELGGWDQWFARSGGESDSDTGDAQASSDFCSDDDDDDNDDDDDDDNGQDNAADSDVSAEQDEDTGDDADGDATDDDGMDWDELAAEAERDDRKREGERSCSRERGSFGGRAKRARR